MSETEEFHYSDERDERVKDTGEVFTPDSVVQSMLDSLEIDWSNPPQDKKFLDPTCGSGNFLVALANRNIPINMLYGVDLMLDNVETTRRRLLEVVGNTDENISIVQNNIVQADALEYNYRFGEPDILEDW